MHTTNRRLAAGIRVSTRRGVAALVVLVAVLGAGCAVPTGSKSTSAGASSSMSLRPTETIRYGAAPTSVADVYLPSAGGNRGVIVMVHGGAFYGGKRSEFTIYGGLVLGQVRRGFAVVNIDYRLTTLSGANLFPAALHDLSNAIGWIRANGAAHGLDTSTIIVAGHSSGATLAQLEGLAANNPNRTRGRLEPVDGWVSISGVSRMESTGLLGALSSLWLGPGATPQRRSDASAIDAYDAADPPGYIIHGAADPLVPVQQSIDLARAGESVGARPWIDIVTEPDCNGHYPTCAENAAYFDMWIDRVVQRTAG